MIADKLKFSFFSLFLFNVTIYASSQEYKDFAYEIEHSVGEQMFNEFGLRLSGSLNSMPEKIEKLGMQFTIYRRATIEEARALHLLVMEKFVQAINSHEKIQPYLAIQPFSFKRATIVISFEGLNGRHSDGSISYMFNVSDLATSPSRNHVIYCSHDPFKDDFIDQLKEPYEEAVRLNAASPVDPTVHQGNDYEEEMDILLASFSNEINKKYGVSVWHVGGKWLHGIEDIGATIKLNHFANQDEARQLLIEVVDKLLTVVNSNEKVRPYLKTYPFPASLLKLSFHFVSTSANPFPDIRLESMALENNAITYVQETLLPKEEGKVFRDSEITTLPLESYAEALQIVENNSRELKIPSSSFLGRMKKWIVEWIF